MGKLETCNRCKGVVKVIEKKELKKLLKEMTARARVASEGYIYLRSDGKIGFSRNSNISFGEGVYIIAGHHTPLKFIRGSEKTWIDMIIEDYYKEEF